MSGRPVPFRFQRVLAALLVLAGLAIMMLLFLSDRPLYQLVLAHWGDYPGEVLFTDLRSVLMQLECHGQGIAVLDANPAADLCGTYNYSPLLLQLPFLRIDPAVTPVLGLSLGGVFALSLIALPIRSGVHDVTCIVLAALSAAVVWAVASANFDLIVFELAMLVSALACARGRLRFAAYGLAMLGGLIKYYPVVLMGHALKERFRVFLGLLLLSLVAATCFVYLFRDELVASMQVLPTGSVLRGRWGAQVLPLGIHWLVEGVPAGGINSTKNMTLPLAGLFMAAFALAIRYARNPVFGSGFLALPPWPRSLLISGALLIVGCFVAWQNLPYRGIFFLLVLPGILMLRSVGAGGDRPMAAMPAAILYLMWQGPVSQGILHGMLFLGLSHAAIVVVQLAIWALTQMIWWWVVILLMTLLCAGLVFPFISRAREPRAPAVTSTGASTPHG